jgi:hypothetical protein
MSRFTSRPYKGFQLDHEYEKGKQERNCVKISLRSGSRAEKYKTPAYETPNEAFSHAYGWIDCVPGDQTEPGEEDSCKNAYNALRKYKDEFYSIQEVSEELSELREQKWEKAYRDGWRKKIDENIGD